MIELTDDPFYKMIGEYKNCIIDYCIIENDTPHQGKRSHKDAILFAMLKVIERYIDTQLKAEIEYCRDIPEEAFPWSLDMGKAKAHPIDSSTLLHAPKTVRTNHTGQRFYDGDSPDSFRGDQIPYWYAFLETPHTSKYDPNDFHRVNSMIFPKGADELEIYEWTTDWSNYFDAGHE